MAEKAGTAGFRCPLGYRVRVDVCSGRTGSRFSGQRSRKHHKWQRASVRKAQARLLRPAQPSTNAVAQALKRDGSNRIAPACPKRRIDAGHRSEFGRQFRHILVYST